MKNILVLIDNSVNSEHLALSAMNIALTIRANITLAHASKKDNSGNNHDLENYESNLHEEQILSGIADYLRTVVQAARKADFMPAVKCLLYPGTVVDLLAETTNDHAIDLVLIGSHQPRSWEKVMFRTRMNDILDHIGCPLMVIPRKFIIDQIAHAIFAVDLSIDYHKALHYFVIFSACFETKVAVINISRLGFPEKHSELDLCELVNSCLDKNLPPVTYHTVRSAQVRSGLLAALESKKVDLLCLVHKNYGFLRRMFHVSISKQLADNVLIPIMILPDDYSVAPVFLPGDQNVMTSATNDNFSLG
ncbi:universal stress protein [Pedobacter psychroterrae]|uniref:Universal stress protein n=1 Tax=Pedobacter psychroterrae TaxID=2530453 RepID=A0A4R0NL42_9SPHI|nr:universal stress protein [Pedobacter psychroterrae]TCD01522.1 universal stress protein [Pedobacter psychroterrae]